MFPALAFPTDPDKPRIRIQIEVEEGFNVDLAIGIVKKRLLAAETMLERVGRGESKVPMTFSLESEVFEPGPGGPAS